jgi:N6-L-threonylcarbamoyladenine synthase
VLLLGIETSCDDTATAVVRDGVRVLANVSTNQDEFHAKYGGIVPEIASRRHAALLSAAVDDARTRAGVALLELDGIAGTLAPELMTAHHCVSAAKVLAFDRAAMYVPTARPPTAALSSPPCSRASPQTSPA